MDDGSKCRFEHPRQFATKSSNSREYPFSFAANSPSVLHCTHVSLYSPFKIAPDSREQDKGFGVKVVPLSMESKTQMAIDLSTKPYALN